MHRPEALTRAGVGLRQITATSPLSPDLETLSRLFTLHRGELEALQVALQRAAHLLLTDDTAARLAARNLAIPVHGTIGILLRATRRGQKSRDEVLAILRSLPATSTLHIHPTLLEDVIRQLERSA